MPWEDTLAHIRHIEASFRDQAQASHYMATLRLRGRPRV
jgi:hypothetical protein